MILDNHTNSIVISRQDISRQDMPVDVVVLLHSPEDVEAEIITVLGTAPTRGAG